MQVALVGRSGSGKSTVARILAEQQGLNHLKTGAICRQIAALLFGSDAKDLTQKLDDALTSIDHSIFLKATFTNHKTELGNCVIDSLRFQSDYDEARHLGFRIWRVSASDEVRYQRLRGRGQAFTKQSMLHRTETELDDVCADVNISNDGDYAALYAAVEGALRSE